MLDGHHFNIYINVISKAMGGAFITDIVRPTNFKEVILSHVSMEKEVYYIIWEDLGSHG